MWLCCQWKNCSFLSSFPSIYLPPSQLSRSNFSNREQSDPQMIFNCCLCTGNHLATDSHHSYFPLEMSFFWFFPRREAIKLVHLDLANLKLNFCSFCLETIHLINLKKVLVSFWKKKIVGDLCVKCIDFQTIQYSFSCGVLGIQEN